jgi:hypothetical protein
MHRTLEIIVHAPAPHFIMGREHDAIVLLCEGDKFIEHFCP